MAGGEHENYADRKQSAIFGLYKKNVSDMSFEYGRPQENGNRCNTYFVNTKKLNFKFKDNIAYLKSNMPEYKITADVFVLKDETEKY